MSRSRKPLIVITRKLPDTIESFERVVAGEFDQLPEQAFYMQGGIEDVVERAKKLETV